MPKPSLFRSLETGEIPFHVFRTKACKSLLQSDFGVDVSRIPDEDLEPTLQWYQADYESFLATIEMSNDRDTIDLANALLDKKNPYLTGGKKGAELLNKILEKLDSESEVDLNKRLNIRLKNADIKIENEVSPEIFSEKKYREKSPLHLAAELGDVVAIKEIFGELETEAEKKAACQERDSDGCTPLHLAAQSESSDAVEEILCVFSTEDEKRNACEEEDDHQNTALHFAAQSKNPENFDKIWAALTDLGKKPACLHKNRDGETPLALAILCGNLKAFKEIWKNLTPAEKKRIYEDKDHNDATLLSLAAMCKNSEIFEAILAVSGTDQEKKQACQDENNVGMTPLHWAACTGNSVIIGSMLAILTNAEKKAACKKVDHKGLTAAHCAVMFNNPIAFEKIFDVFTDAEKFQFCQKEVGDMGTLLHLAAVRGNPEIFERLLDVFVTDAEKMAACKKENPDGSTVDLVCDNADNPIHILKIIENLSPALIEEPMIRAIEDTPLAKAMKRGKSETAEYLFKFLPGTFSLEDARILLTLSQDSGNFATQEIVLNKIIEMFKKLSEDNQREFLNAHGVELIKACKACGNTNGFNTLAPALAKIMRVEAEEMADAERSRIERLRQEMQAAETQAEEMQAVEGRGQEIQPAQTQVTEIPVEVMQAVEMQVEAELDALPTEAVDQETDNNVQTPQNSTIQSASSDDVEVISAEPSTEQEKLQLHLANGDVITIMDGAPPLHLAIFNGDLKAFKKIWDPLTAAGKKVICEEEDDDGATLLFVAMIGNNKEIFETILAVSAADDKEKKLLCQKQTKKQLLTLLHLAAAIGNLEIIESIFAVLADAERKDACEKVDYQGLTVVHYAVVSNNPIAFEKIIASFKTPADKLLICQKEDLNGFTPFHFAAMRSNPEIFERILGFFGIPEEQIAACRKKHAKGSIVDLTIQYADNPIPILEIIVKLSRTLIDEPMMQPIRNTPLAKAVKLGKAETAEYLLKFLPVNVSLEDARVLLTLSQASGDLATQSVVTNKIIGMLKNLAEDDDDNDNQQQFLSEHRDELLKACNACGNTSGTEWLQETRAASPAHSF